MNCNRTGIDLFSSSFARTPRQQFLKDAVSECRSDLLTQQEKLWPSNTYSSYQPGDTVYFKSSFTELTKVECTLQGFSESELDASYKYKVSLPWTLIFTMSNQSWSACWGNRFQNSLYDWLWVVLCCAGALSWLRCRAIQVTAVATSDCSTASTV